MSSGVVTVGQEFAGIEFVVSQLKLSKLSMHGHDDVKSSHGMDPLDLRGLVSDMTSMSASSLYLNKKKERFDNVYVNKNNNNGIIALTDDIDDVPVDFRWQIEVSLAILSSKIAVAMSAGTYYGS